MPKKSKTIKRTVAFDTKKIVVIKKENPFREGSGAFKRTNIVLAARGKTVEYAVSKGARRSTVRRLAEMKIVRAA